MAVLHLVFLVCFFLGGWVWFVVVGLFFGFFLLSHSLSWINTVIGIFPENDENRCFSSLQPFCSFLLLVLEKQFAFYLSL